MALSHYYSTHLEELRAFALSHTGRRDVAEDLVQDAFVRLLQPGRVIMPAALPSLVYTTLRHLISDYWRRRRTREEFEHAIVASPASAASALSPATVYNAHEIARLLEQGIARLSTTQQRVYRLSIYDGKAVSQIAVELQLNYKTTERHLGTARRQVRDYIRRMAG